MRHKIAGFYRVLSVSVVPSVSVESAMESNDVLMTSFFAVSSSSTHRSPMIIVQCWSEIHFTKEGTFDQRELEICCFSD